MCYDLHNIRILSTKREFVKSPDFEEITQHFPKYEKAR